MENMAHHAEIAALVEEWLNGLLGLIERIIYLWKHLGKTDQALSPCNANLCFGVPGPNPSTLPDPVRFNRYSGLVFPNKKHATWAPRKKQLVRNQSPVSKEKEFDQLPRDEPPILKGREFTLLPVSMSVIWPILFRKGIIQQGRAFSWFESTRNYIPGKFCDFHCGQEGHSVEECVTLRFRVQDMIDTGNLMFRAWKYCDGNLDMIVVPSMRLEYPHMFEDEAPPPRCPRGVTWNTWDD